MLYLIQTGYFSLTLRLELQLKLVSILWTLEIRVELHENISNITILLAI